MTIKRGSAIRARDVAAIPRNTLRGVIDGPGVQTLRSGDSMSVSSLAEPVRGGGGISIPMVAVLPVIPTSGTRIVFWGSSDTVTDGTGDDQYWTSHVDADRWYPMGGIYTTLSGVPV